MAIYDNINNVVNKEEDVEELHQMDVNNLLEYAITEVEHIENDEVFLVKDLFKGYEWNRIPRKDRLLLGTLFLNFINKVNGNVLPAEKTSSGQQKYKKLL